MNWIKEQSQTDDKLECPLCHGSTENIISKQVEYDNRIVEIVAQRLKKAIVEERATFTSELLNEIVRLCISKGK